MTDQLGSALGLALLAVAGTTAGFLAASIPTGTGVGSGFEVLPGQAREVDPLGGALTVHASGDRAARVLLFDANASFEQAVRVPAGATLQGIQMEPKTRLVLVHDQGGPAQLRVDGGEEPTVETVRTRETVRTLVTSNGGTVDADRTVNQPSPPASLSLRVDGRAHNLDATVRTRAGPAFEQTNATWAGNLTEGRLELNPGNLTDGTYRVSVGADRVTGSVQLVTRTFDQANRSTALDPPDEALDKLGGLVATAGEDEAWRVSTQGAGALTLAIEQGSWARVRLYDADERHVRAIDVGRRGPAWEFGSNGSQAPAYQAVRLDVRDGTYTLYPEKVSSDNATVYAILPGREEPHAGRQLEIETRTIDVAYPQLDDTSTKTVRYGGGLLDVRVAGGEGASANRRVVVDSPLGVVLRQEGGSAASDTSVGGEGTRYVERFGSGPLDIRVENDGGLGSVTLEIEHYVP